MQKHPKFNEKHQIYTSEKLNKPVSFTSSRFNVRHIIEVLNDKEKDRTLKAAKGKNDPFCLMYKGLSIRLIAGFSTKTLETRSYRDEIYKGLSGKEKAIKKFITCKTISQNLVIKIFTGNKIYPI